MYLSTHLETSQVCMFEYKIETFCSVKELQIKYGSSVAFLVLIFLLFITLTLVIIVTLY